jgi:hypothetical protein
MNRAMAYDLWESKSIGNYEQEISVSLRAHASILLKLTS